MNKPFGANKRVGDRVVTDLPGHQFGEIVEISHDDQAHLWALVKIKERQTWFPCSLLFVIPSEWETSGVRT